MIEQIIEESPSEPIVTVEEVNRVLELGRLLLTVLTPEELEQLQVLFSQSFNQPTPIDQPV